jgi:multiple sugar transport system permease protein
MMAAFPLARAIRSAPRRAVGDWSVLFLMILFLVYALAPVAYLMISATKSNSDLFGTFGFAFGNSFELGQNLSDLLAREDGIFLRWLLNSALYSGIAAVASGIISTMAGYAFAKFRFAGREVLFALVFVAVLVPQTALIVPLFLLLSMTGLTDNPLGVILPSTILPIGIYMMRYYIERAVDDGLIEAARIDGAGEFRIFRDIVLRLAAPGMVTVMILTFVGSWNNYFLPLVVLRTPELMPATVGLAAWYQLAAAGGGGQALFTVVIAGALISVLPVIAVFLMLQRFWQGGLSAGAIK